jgi:isocitrate lyase
MTDFYNLVPSAPEGRFDGIERPYSPADVKRLRGSVEIKYTLAEMGANRLWKLIHEDDFVNALGALSGNQAMQMVRAGLKAIYLSGWQVAADANTASAMYPDQSLYPANAGPELAKRINRTLQRADQIETQEGKGHSVETWFAPIVADAEAGFGGPLNSFELMKAYIEAGAAGVHYEDQLASEKKCGHLGGKVLIPTSAHVRNLNAARLAADVMGVPTLVVARTDAEAAKLLTSDIDENDKPFVDYDAGRTAEGFYHVKNGLEPCIARAVKYAPHADLIWCETSKPDLAQAKKFAEGVRKHHPNKLLAYNCSPSFNWKKNLDDATIAKFQRELGAMGYKYQFITLAGIHNMWYHMYDLAQDYAQRGMSAYVEKVQEPEFAARDRGYTFVSHQQEVGTGYFDDVTTVIQGGVSSVTALTGSTEEEQFH